MSKLCITPIHLGRYKIEMLDENNQVLTGYDCGSAGVFVALSEWLYKPEHAQYQRDQKANSDALGEAAINDMKRNPSKYLPYKPKAIKDGR